MQMSMVMCSMDRFESIRNKADKKVSVTHNHHPTHTLSLSHTHNKFLEY